MLYRNDSFVKLYLRGDDLADHSPSPKTVTDPSGGSVTSMVVSGVPSGKGINLPGVATTDRLDVAHTGADFDLGKVFTVDAWVTLDNLTNGSGFRTICMFEGTAFVNQDYWLFALVPNGGTGSQVVLQWRYNNGTIRQITSAGFTCSVGTPLHIMIAGDGSTIRQFVDGRNVSGSMPTFDPLNFAAGTRRGLTVGARYNNGVVDLLLDGKITGLRVSKGVCRAGVQGFSKPNRIY